MRSLLAFKALNFLLHRMNRGPSPLHYNQAFLPLHLTANRFHLLSANRAALYHIIFLFLFFSNTCVPKYYGLVNLITSLIIEIRNTLQIGIAFNFFGIEFIDNLDRSRSKVLIANIYAVS